MLQATPAARPGLQYLDWFRTMRQTTPVWRDPSTGYWNVFRYDDAVAVMHDFHTYSSERPGAGMFDGDIINMDPPRHDQLRGIVSQVFTPRAIAQLEPRIRGITEGLLAQTEGRSELELIDDLAFPLPVTVIAEMLGIPAADRPLFRQWSNELHRMTDVDLATEAARAEAAQIMGRFQSYLHDHVRDRRRQPRNDLLSGLVRAELDGQRLSDDEIVGFATILLIAGHVTTTSALANAMLCFDEYPEAQRALREDPAKLPAAIEEVLRYRSPVGRVERVATQNVSLHGNEVTRGEEVHIWLQSANRDNSAFPDADEFILDRQPNRHLAFATGIHFCLGAPLARLELQCALDILLKRYSHIRVDSERPAVPYPTPVFGGVEALWLQVER